MISCQQESGWCNVTLPGGENLRSWGFCDSSIRLNRWVKEDHPYYEVETTIVPGKECHVDEGEFSQEGADIEAGNLYSVMYCCIYRKR